MSIKKFIDHANIVIKEINDIEHINTEKDNTIRKLTKELNDLKEMGKK